MYKKRVIKLKIGIFDSGLGGLTVLKQIIKNHPNCEYYYFGDNINIPYGNKTKEQLTILVDRIIKFLLTKDVDIIIIACGTVSSTLYDDLDYGIPIYNIIYNTIDYINESNYKKIGVIATENTINSKIFNDKINREVVGISCPLLVTYIEQDLKADSLIKSYLKLMGPVDAIVLGCTHYPIIADKIKHYAKVPLIDMGEVLSQNIHIKEGKALKIKMYFTKVDNNLKDRINQIIHYEYELIEVK